MKKSAGSPFHTSTGRTMSAPRKATGAARARQDARTGGRAADAFPATRSRRRRPGRPGESRPRQRGGETHFLDGYVPDLGARLRCGPNSAGARPVLGVHRPAGRGAMSSRGTGRRQRAARVLRLTRELRHGCAGGARGARVYDGLRQERNGSAVQPRGRSTRPAAFAERMPRAYVLRGESVSPGSSRATASPTLRLADELGGLPRVYGYSIKAI